MEKPKIGLFIDTFFPMVDGVIMVVDNYARRLMNDFDVTVFAPVGRKNFNDSTLPYKVVRCESKFPLFFLDYDLPMPNQDRKFKKALKESNLDIVHIHSPFSIGEAGLKYAKKHNIPCIATMHSQFRQDFKRSVKSNLIANAMVKKIMKVFNACNECWAVNSKIAEVFVEYGAKQLPKVQNNGTDLLPFEDKNQIKELRNQYGIKNDEKVFLFIGRLTALKNIFFILDALKELDYKNFKFKMLYVGSGQDKDKLVKKIKEYGLEDKVILTGRITEREEISKYYKMADLFLFPSLYDASSLVQIEAASQKTPSLFLKGAATADTVTDNVTGYLADNSTKAYADKIIEIFDNEEQYKNICENAFKSLYVHWGDVVKKAENDYINILNNFKKN